MMYKINATNEELKEIGLDIDMNGKYVHILKEYDNIWTNCLHQFFMCGIFLQNEISVPKEYLIKV